MDSVLDRINIVPSYKVEIPRTTPQRYVTGIYALNIQSPEGTSGDWHDVFCWLEGEKPRTVTLGGTEDIDTTPIYGDLGIYEGRDRIGSRAIIPEDVEEVYIANHFRAVWDLLYQSLVRYGKIYNLDDASIDWFDTPEQQTYLLDKAEWLLPHLPTASQAVLRNWIAKERTKE